jgi:hypothetical protein
MAVELSGKDVDDSRGAATGYGVANYALGVGGQVVL